MRNGDESLQHLTCLPGAWHVTDVAVFCWVARQWEQKKNHKPSHFTILLLLVRATSRPWRMGEGRGAAQYGLLM